MDWTHAAAFLLGLLTGAAVVAAITWLFLQDALRR